MGGGVHGCVGRHDAFRTAAFHPWGVLRLWADRLEKKRSVASQGAIGDHAARRGVTIGLEALNRFECYLVNTMDAL